MCPCNIFWCTNDILPFPLPEGISGPGDLSAIRRPPKGGQIPNHPRPAEDRKELSLAHLSGPDPKPVAMDAAEEGLSTGT